MVATRSSSGSIRIYVNGLLDGSSTSAVNIDNTQNLTFGSDTAGWTGGFLDGSLRDVRIYNDALTSDEVTYLYTEGASGTDPTTTNLVGHWKLDEGEGSVIADSAGSNDGQAKNITEPAFWDRYAVFDGVDDYVDMSSGFGNGNDPMSVSAWIRSGDYSGFNSTYGAGIVKSYSGGSDGDFILGVTSSNIKFIHYISTTDVRKQFSTSLSANTWYHIVVTYDSGTFTCYVDAVSQTPTVDGSTSSGWGNENVIGRGYAGSGYYFSGDIRDVRIYHKALTSDEVTYLYTAGESGTNPGTANLVGHWKLNEGEGTLVSDSAGSNDGTAINTTESTFWRQVAMQLDGTGDFASAPHISAYNLPTEFELICKVALADYTPATTQTLCGNWTRAYSLALVASGRPVLNMYNTSHGYFGATASTTIPGIVDGASVWLRATFDNGSVKFYYGDDGVNWTQLGTTITASNSETYTGASFLTGQQIGAQSGGGNPTTGKIYRAITKDGIDGDVVFDADFSNQLLVGKTSFEESSVYGATVTLSGDAAIARS